MVADKPRWWKIGYTPQEVEKQIQQQRIRRNQGWFFTQQKDKIQQRTWDKVWTVLWQINKK